MRTHIYVDGFNLYYGALKGTRFKWLDLASLFQAVLRPHHDILKIKYFTARVSARQNNPSQQVHQDIYLQALQHHCPEVEVYFGHFLTHTVRAPLANSRNNPKIVSVIRTEEKGSDVNLAVHLLNDCWLDAYDCAIVVSNDSDIAEAMRLVKAQTNKIIGLIKPGSGHPSQQLIDHANFFRRIGTTALRNSQLPSPVPGTNLTKPVSW